MFPIEGHKSKIEINLGAYLKNRRLFDRGEELEFTLFRDYLITQNREDLVYHYTHGLCGVLATCLHQLLGWEVKGIALNGEYVHMGVENPDTYLYTDARGSELSDRAFSGMYKAWHGSHCSVGRAYPVDQFIPDAHKKYYYAMCLLEHVPILLPQYRGKIEQLKESFNGH